MNRTETDKRSEDTRVLDEILTDFVLLELRDKCVEFFLEASKGKVYSRVPSLALRLPHDDYVIVVKPTTTHSKGVAVDDRGVLIECLKRCNDAVQNKFFPSPLYSVHTRRPFFSEEMQAVCMDVRKRNCGVNGKPILFYAARHPLGQQHKPMKKPRADPKQKNQYADLLDGLRSLGLDVTAAQVEPVLKELFPAGIQHLDCGEVSPPSRNNTCQTEPPSPEVPILSNSSPLPMETAARKT